MRRAVLTLALGLSSGAWAGPLLSLLTTCTRLAPNFYPADTINWFEASKNPQIVLYAHMLFPLQEEQKPGLDLGLWHPPLVLPALPPRSPYVMVRDEFFAEAVWTDPDGIEIASHGLTMAARVSTDYVQVDGRTYIPHTFTHTIGTRDLRSSAGQKSLPQKAGQYHVRLKVGGEALGLAFFRMLSGSAPAPAQATPTAQALPTLRAK